MRAAALACGLVLGLTLAAPVVPAQAAGQPAAQPRPAVRAVSKSAAKPDKRLRNPRLQKILKQKLATHDPADGLLGAASFYGYGFQGRRVASGERFDVRALTAASNRFPVGTWLAVNRLSNGRCVAVRVNDRMHASHRLRVVDLSRSAAEQLDMLRDGVVLVRVRALAHPPASGECPPDASETPPLSPDTLAELELPGAENAALPGFPH